MNYKFLLSFSFLLLLCMFYLIGCQKKDVNYILYYQKVNEIDSIYRIAGNPRLAAEEYKRLFDEYEPRNLERIREYETYIQLADKYNIDFGGKKGLKKLIPLIAPHGEYYKLYFPLFKKYGIDSLSLKEKVADWKKGLNQTLIDSFTVAMKRDQEGRPIDTALTRRNVEKNSRFLIWVFNKYGYPTPQKMGTMGHNDTFFAMTTFLTHMSETKKYYPEIKSRLYGYIKSGDCAPRDYALMIDGMALLNNTDPIYLFNPGVSKDSAQTNRNRKSIGLPSIKHTNLLVKDSFMPVLITENRK